MKKTGRKVMSMMLCLVLCALAGCAGGTGETHSASVPSSSPETELSTPPTPISTPVPTPVPTTAAASESYAIPSPSPTATPDDGRVTIADGFYFVKLSAEIKQRITGMSYPADDSDAAITYDDLRYIRLRYYDFEGKEHSDGELIVNKKLAKEVTQIFYELFQAKYPFTSIRLVDDFGQPGDDTLSMEANNTSGFCYRQVTGSSTLSRHSLGAAIDINPLYNPYIDGDRVAPENGAQYVDRTLGLPGMIDHDDLCYKLFIQHGWTWGGDWSGDKDYQHFSKKL